MTTLPLCGSNVTFGSLATRGIDALRPGLVELDVSYCVRVADDVDFVDYVRPSAETLRTLKIAGIKKGIDFEKLFSVCTNLQHLDASFTSMTTSDVEFLCTKLSRLQYLDISQTKADLVPSLVAIKRLTSLKYIGLCGIKIEEQNEGAATRAKDVAVECFSALTQLTHLDYSCLAQGNVLEAVFEGTISSAKSLTHLNVSFSSVASSLFYLVARLESHGLLKRLSFLGALEDSSSSSSSSFNPDPDLVALLRRDIPVVALGSHPAHSTMLYSELWRRPFSVLPGVLQHYRQLTCGKHPDDLAIAEALSLLIHVVQLATEDNELISDVETDIVLYASAAFAGTKSTPKLLALRLVDLLIAAYQRQPRRGVIGSVLLKAPFMAIQSGMMSCRSFAGLVDCLLSVIDPHSTDGWSVHSRFDAVQLLNLLILNLSDEQKIFLTRSSHLFDFVFSRLQEFTDSSSYAEMAGQFLVVLWNMCDGVRESCAALINRVAILLRFGVQFSEHTEAVMCVIGAVGNAAEFAEFRSALRVPDMIRLIETALRIPDRGGTVQFTASRLLCMLSLDDTWESLGDGVPSRSDMLAAMVKMLRSASLKPNSKRSISFKSLEPLVELVRCQHTAAIRLFGVWRIACLANAKPQVYCPMLKREGSLDTVFGVSIPDEMRDDFGAALDVLKLRCNEYADRVGVVEDDRHVHSPMHLFILHEQGLMKYFHDEHHHHHHDDDDDDEDDGSDDDDDDGCLISDEEDS